MLNASIKKILPPLVVGPSHEAHDVAAGVEIEGARLAHELHAGFAGELVALAAIAGMAAGHKILPSGSATARPRDNVVKRQVARGQHFTAELTGIAVTQQNVFARECARLVRNSSILEQTDYRGQTHGDACGVQEVSVFFLGHGDALEHENDGAAGGTYIDGLIRGIQHQHGRMQYVGSVAVTTHTDGYRRGHVSPGAHRVVPLP